MATRVRLFISSGSKKEEPRCVCLSEAKASHSHRMWVEFSSCVPHPLHKRIGVMSPNNPGLCPVKVQKSGLCIQSGA